VATVGYISVMYENELKESYQKKSALLSQQLSDPLEKYEGKRIRMEGLETAVLQISRHTDTDVDVYDKKGRLIISSQPAIYSAGILSSLMDPLAIYEILEKQSNAALLPQKVGNFSYFKVFHSVRSAETGEVIGILGLPFFGSKEELNRRRTEIVNYMLNIFTLIFIFFLLISFLSARILIVPLKIVTQKIRKVTLTGINEPIHWDSKDEIGILISEYNNMLIKLKTSTKALANAEKETAWREMARQVAHEIKNPLTPMKLSLQYFKRRLEMLPHGLDSQPLDTVLQQIDKLATIANSFSSFASFPEPIHQPYDVILALKTCIDLHNNDGQEIVEDKLDSKSCIVLGDVGFMERIFTNLILNAIQAVPIGRVPQIIIGQKIINDKFTQISVSDNGDGIPDEIKDKVFLPNFSTKYAGSGIGLALAKKGIEQAGGKIWFESEAGNGTTFYIELSILSFVEK
ncbi:MAG: HAMP domain-containing histidine kinase, partial [Cytophagales bacterium]|nr:HAMP domain-containing histidine kinase [Cytophagales bacterium]